MTRSRSPEIHDLVQIGQDGRLHGLGSSLRALTARHAGHFSVAPGEQPGSLLLAPLGKNGGIPSELEGEILLSGAIDVFGGPAELLSLLANARRDGYLTFISGPFRRSLLLLDGRIRWAASNDRYDRLGEVLYRSGLMDRHQLADLLHQAAQARRPIGNHLVQAGVISKDELYALLKRQADDIFLGIVEMTDGDFILVEPAESNRMSVDIAAQHFLLDAVRRMDEIAHLERRLTSGNFATLSIAADAVIDERPIYEQVAKHLQAPKPPHQLFELIPQPRRFVVEALGQMMTLNWVTLSSEEPRLNVGAQEPGIPVDQNIEIIQRFNQLFSSINAATETRAEIDLNRTLKTFLQFYGYTTLLAGAEIDAEGTIEPSILLQNLNQIRHPNGSTSYLERALSELLHFTLFATRSELEREHYRELQQRASGLFRAVD